MKIRIILWLLLLLIFSCTAPRVVTSISPEAPEGHFTNGREYIPLESDQIKVELGYDGLLGDQLVFDFVAFNGTPDTLQIRPEDFFYVVLDSVNAESDYHASWYSVDPDTVLLHYDRSLKDREDQKGVNTLLGILEASVNLLYNTSGFIATEDPGFIVDAVFSTVGTADRYLRQDRMISEQMGMIGEEKALVSQEIFRTCSLPPGQVCSGYICFPVHEQCAYYMFCFPVGQELFQFVYRQQKELVY